MKTIAPDKFPLTLLINRTLRDSDFEFVFILDCHDDQASAEASLAAQKGGWTEASLCVRDGWSWRAKYRRTPHSEWRQVRRWPTVKNGARPPLFIDDVHRIAAWLERAGVTADWSALLREPWPGRERGEELGGSLQAPNEHLRTEERRREYSAVETIVMMIMQEGIERGAFIRRSREMANEENQERLDRMSQKTLKSLSDRTEELESELETMREEMRRIKESGGRHA